jgi:hypothetical protein
MWAAQGNGLEIYALPVSRSGMDVAEAAAFFFSFFFSSGSWIWCFP